MTDLHHVKNRSGLSALFPEEAHRYLAHTAEGRPLREIAREAGCHASTVLRQVRKLETLRDDPLVDRVLAAHGLAGC
jgi:DNA-binding CsgD family transcriptional regulator